MTHYLALAERLERLAYANGSTVMEAAAALREAAADGEHYDCNVAILTKQRDDLQAEVERLKEQFHQITMAYASECKKVERLREALNDWLYANGPDGWIEELRRERERLKALLREARDYVANVSVELGNPARNGAMDCVASIDAALEAK